MPVTPGLDSRDGVLDDHRACRLNPEELCRHQERIRADLGQVLGMDHIAIDSHLEEGTNLAALKTASQF